MTTGFEKITVTQLSQALSLAGVTDEELMVLSGKKSYVAKAVEVGIKPEDIIGSEEETVIADFSTIEEIDKDEIPEATDAPSPDSLEWHDWIMSLFDPSELFNGLPNINGLRRVAIMVRGEPVFSGVIDSRITHGTTPNDPGRASCTYEVRFVDRQNMIENTYRGVGGSYVGNTDNEYAAFPEAIAETRAESRALRKALYLKVNSAEELTTKNTASVIADFMTASTGEWGAAGEDQFATPQQVNLINKMCGDLGVNVSKFINKKYHLGQSTEPQFEAIEKVPRSIAAVMIQELNKYQTMTDVSKDIPKEILV